MDYKAVVIGGSAGSFAVVSKLLAALPTTFPLPVIVCMHRQKLVSAGFAQSLGEKSALPVEEPCDKDPVRRGVVFLAPANYHCRIEYDRTFALSTEAPENFCRPAIDYTLASASKCWRNQLIGIILTGANKDGGKGLKSIADRGGYTIVQDPETAAVPTMPRAALRLIQPNEILSPAGITDFLKHLQ